MKYVNSCKYIFMIRDIYVIWLCLICLWQVYTYVKKKKNASRDDAHPVIARHRARQSAEHL